MPLWLITVITGLGPIVLYCTLKSWLRYRKRIVTVTILIDRTCAFDKNISWGHLTAKIRNMIQNSSALFQKEFAISFSISDILPYDFSADPNNCVISDYFKELRVFAKKNSSNIIIGFTTKELLCTSAVDEDIFEQCIGFGYNTGVAIINLNQCDNINTHTLKHELGHVFGAIHCYDNSSIMLKGLSLEQQENIFTDVIYISPPIPQIFDYSNRQMILSNKFKKFSKELPSSNHIEDRTA